MRRRDVSGTLHSVLVGMGVLCGLWPVALVRAEQTPYQAVIHSTAWVLSPVVSGDAVQQMRMGTAEVIDADARLLLTAYHVVRQRTQVIAFFPMYCNGTLVTNVQPYRSQANVNGIEGKVVWVNAAKDLALIELPRLPADAHSLPIAQDAPQPGSVIYTIGNSGANDDVLWRLSQGVVRQLCSDRSTLAADSGGVDTVLEVRADMIETQVPINEGDSGGPVFDQRGQLVGVASHTNPQNTLVSYMIQADEVRATLAAYRFSHPPALPKLSFDGLGGLQWPSGYRPGDSVWKMIKLESLPMLPKRPAPEPWYQSKKLWIFCGVLLLAGMFKSTSKARR